MPTPLPKTMRSLFVSSYQQPRQYKIGDLPIPVITKPEHVLVNVHAASINPSDMAGAGGAFKMATELPMPFVIGYDLSGTVAAVGTAVTELKVGDEVFCCLPWEDKGSIAGFALTSESFLVKKPSNLNHAEAASLPMVAYTAYQALAEVEGGLQGKTVLIPAGLSGVGSIACQMAKNCLRAAKIISTVSTGKMARIDELLRPGIIDQVVDYETRDPLAVIPHGSIDVLFDTSGVAMSYLPLLRKNGTIISIYGLGGY